MEMRRKKGEDRENPVPVDLSSENRKPLSTLRSRTAADSTSQVPKLSEPRPQGDTSNSNLIKIVEQKKPFIVLKDSDVSVDRQVLKPPVPWQLSHESEKRKENVQLAGKWSDVTLPVSKR